jgi:predicted ATPase
MQRPQLIGRQSELAQVLAQVEAARAGRSGVVMLAGEPGIGKTRLLDEVAAHAVGDGAAVLRGGASEAEGMPPYLPFLEALGAHIRSTPPDVLREQVGEAAAPLAAILPELGAHLREADHGYSLPPEQARLRLYEAVGQLLAGIAAPAPWC